VGGVCPYAMATVKPDINITPLIDVLLVLLIIFMVISPVEPARWEAKTPQKPKDVGKSDATLLVVTLAADGALALNSAPIAQDELGPRLTAELEGRVDRTVILKAPKELPYARVGSVVDIVEGAGAEPLGLQIDFLD
jgi:biopolymer transport protein ExbD